MAVSKRQILILNQQQIQKKIQRLAYQILEDYFEEEEIILVGIADQGFVLANRIQSILNKIDAAKKYTLVNLHINKEASSLISSLDTPLESLQNKAILLIDDVSNSGKTLTYAMGTFLNISIKKIRTLVLIDRSHHQFPVAIDFYGLNLATTLKEHVRVELNGFKEFQNDAAWLE